METKEPNNTPIAETWTNGYNSGHLTGMTEGLAMAANSIMELMARGTPPEALRAILRAWAKGEDSGLLEFRQESPEDVPEARLVDDWKERI